MKLLLVLFLLAAAAGVCFAQLSLPDVTDSQFDRTDSSLNQRPLLLSPFAGGLVKPGIAYQEQDQLTIRQTQAGRGVLEDLHANSNSINALFDTGQSPHSPRIYLHGEQLANSGTLDQGATQIGLSGNLSESDAGVVWPTGRLTLRAVYEQDHYTAGGQSNVYENLFHNFPPEPPLSLSKQNQLGTVSAAYQVAPAWSAEVDITEESSPGSISLIDPTGPARLQIPLGDHGSAYTEVLTYRASHYSTIYAFAGSGSFHGSGAVDIQNNLPVGPSTESRTDRQAGLAWERRFGGSRTLRVYGEEDRSAWNVQGFIPMPSQIGITQPFAQDLTFAASYNLNDDLIGASWEEKYGASHTLYADYRYGQVTGRVSASEGLILLVFPAGSSSTENIDNLKGHILQLRYGFPIWRLQATLGALQLIPATTSASVSGGNSTSGGVGAGGKALGPEHTYGGWALTWELGYSF